MKEREMRLMQKVTYVRYGIGTDTGWHYFQIQGSTQRWMYALNLEQNRVVKWKGRWIEKPKRLMQLLQLSVFPTILE